MSDALPTLDEECFFIAPIGRDGSSERERSDKVLEFIVGKAAQKLGLIAVRGDRIAEPGQITRQVIDHVLGARAAVADLTGLNPNVFYELAVRHAARLPIALIAEKDCLLPFDIAHMRTIFFDHTDLRSADFCENEIVSQLKQALQGEATDNPVAMSIDIHELALGSIREKRLAETVAVMEEIAREQMNAQVQAREFVMEFSHEVMETLSAVRKDNDQFIARTAQESRQTLQALVAQQIEPLINQLNTTLEEFRKHGEA